ncbi:hypothetical protein C8J57DRAFT_1246943 [Mycena rebaudengoi]|nr:hypothetical protein C8J57DRAFT_1246943 [Mycena rebaudengoi]
MDRSAAGCISGGRAPYNVIAFAVGHNHGTGPMPNWINATYNGVTHRIPEFRPGPAFWKNAALIRVTPSVMDVGYVNSNNLSSPWISGSVGQDPTNNGNYFGPLKSIYVDTRALQQCGWRDSKDPEIYLGSRLKD